MDGCLLWWLVIDIVNLHIERSCSRFGYRKACVDRIDYHRILLWVGVAIKSGNGGDLHKASSEIKQMQLECSFEND